MNKTLKELKEKFYCCGHCDYITKTQHSAHFLKQNYKFSFACNEKECYYVTEYNYFLKSIDMVLN